MRIGIDARALTVPVFGIGRYTICLINVLKQRADVKLFLYADRPIIENVIGENIEVRAYPKWNPVLSLFRSQWQFAQWAIQDDLDVFWSPRHHLPLWLDPSIRSVVTIHDLVWQKFPETMLRRNLFVEKLLMKRSIKKADKVIAVSESTASDIIAAFPFAQSKVKVIAEAIVAADVPERSLHEVPYFLFVGTQEPRKNINTLVAAFELYRNQGGRHELIIIGAKGWKHDNVISPQVLPFVHVLGRVSDAVLMAYYRFAEALVFPSLYEGFGLPVLEAMQFGTPVIASDRSSLPEVVGEGGIFVDPMSATAICKAMDAMVGEQGLRAKLSDRARNQVKGFSWQKAASQTMDIFQAITSK